MSSHFWHNINESNYLWERDALEFIRQRFPEREPYRAWQLFEFIDEDGRVAEVDLLVLTPAGFFLVEIKSRPGIIRGDAGTWTWEHEGKLFTDDNPVISANRKAKKLKSLLEKQKAIKNLKGRLPFLDVLVFCSAPGQQLSLEGTGPSKVCLRDRDAMEGQPARPGIMAALERRDCPGLDQQQRTHIDRPLAKAISLALDQAGIRPSKRSRKVLDFVLNNIIQEGPGFQDWQATHVKLEEVKRRVRLYVVHSGATPDERKMNERAALREFQLPESLQHPGILRTHGFTEFVNADVIAQGLSAFGSENVAMQAGRVMLERLEDLAGEKLDFAFETTLASRSFAPRLQKLRTAGYRAHLLFLWLPSPEMAVARVASRVQQGGHNVPEEVVIRRYDAGLRNLFRLYMPIVETWIVFDNSRRDGYELIATGRNSTEIIVANAATWKSIEEKYA